MSPGVRIDAAGPLDTTAVIATLVNHEITGLSETRPGEMTHRRIIEVRGEPVEITLRFDPRGVTIEGDLSGPGPGAVARVVRDWFDLDSDIDAIDRHLATHPRFTDQVSRRPGIRITGHADLYEATILIVIGQQISLAAARTFAGRLVIAHGDSSGSLRRFPTPRHLARIQPERLREELAVTGARARTLIAVAELFADRSGPGAEPDDAGLLEELAALPGIGPWTLSSLALRGMGSPDEFPVGDAVLRRALGGMAGPEASDLAEAWRPFRSYATVRLWAEYAGAEV